MTRGIVAGYPMVDMKATVFDGSYHEVDSSEIAFKMAGSLAFKDAATKANPVVLEPIMSVEVIMPEEYMGTIIGDLSSKRGQVQEMTDRGSAKVVKAKDAALRNVWLYHDIALDEPGSRRLEYGI